MAIPPNHRIFVPNINNKSPRYGASNPQKRVVSSVHSQLKKSHNPLALSYNYPNFPLALFLSTCPTQGMHPFTTLSPSGTPFIYQGLSGVGNQEYHYYETQGSSLLGKILGNNNNHLFLQCNSQSSSLFRLITWFFYKPKNLLI
jgi:hypothetical protein